jgi:hypothetical protein
VVECDLAKVEVAGSTPVSRSRNLALAPRRGFLAGAVTPVTVHRVEAELRSLEDGAVAKCCWKHESRLLHVARSL